MKRLDLSVEMCESNESVLCPNPNLKREKEKFLMRTKLLTLLVLLSVLLSACGGNAAPANAPAADEAPAAEAPAAEEAPAEEASAEEAVVLTLGSWRVDDVDEWNLIIDAFNAEYPNITINFDPTNPPDYNAALRTQLETGTGPDLFYARSFATGVELYESGYLAKLNDLSGLSEAVTDENNAPWMNSAGDKFAVPIAAVSHGIYYNKDLFEANGLSIPATWEELMADAEILKNAGVIPFANGTKDVWDINEVVFQALVPNNIGGYEGRMEYQNGTKCVNDADMVAAFQQVLDLQPYLPDGFSAVSYYDGQQLFTQGVAAMYFDGSWSITAFEADEPEFEWGVFAAPPAEGKDQYVTFHMDAAIGMNPATEHPEEAKTFLSWLLTESFGESFGNNVPGFFPVSNNVPELTNPVAAEFLANNAAAAGTDIRFTWETMMVAPSGETNGYSALDAVLSPMLNGDLTAQEAADSWQAALAPWYEPAQNCGK
jgi:raffinose/stachyose/melibiose transport system substrate-binding protein